VPEQGVDDTARLARMALAMKATTANINQGETQIQLRMGLATGTVMAGVIGTKKFSYDVWGDAVNLASRLEALSQPGTILVCPATRAALGERFTFVDAGEADVRGVGKIAVFKVLSER
jgi:adenylate cyclase